MNISIITLNDYVIPLKIAAMQIRGLFKIFRIIALLGMVALLGACPTASTLLHPNNDNNNPDTQSFFLFNLYPHKTFWQTLSNHFTLHDNSQQANVAKEIRWYQKRQYYINQLTANARPFIYYIYKETQKRHMPAELALLPMIESNYNPFLYSKRGATGLWQMMPGTASGFGLTINWWYDGRRSIIDSTKAALDYLAYLHDYFGDWLLAIAAYDSGEGTVQAAVLHNKHLGRPTDFWSLPLPSETKTYVPKLLALAALIKYPHKYGIYLNSINNKPYFTTIAMDHQIDLYHAAKLAHTDVKTIRQLNPGFRRWATIPDQPYSLVLPINKADLFKKQLKYSKNNVTWLHHRIEKGDTLSAIASHYHSAINAIKRINGLKSNTLHIGDKLLVPLAANGNYHFHKLSKQDKTIAEDHVPGPKQIIHRVRYHESLWKIAAHYGVTPNELRYWNNLAYHGRLHFGQTLIIWKNQRHFHRHYYKYRVQVGDSLSVIASRFHANVKTIKSLNKLPSNIIKVGQQLYIPRSNPV